MDTNEYLMMLQERFQKHFILERDTVLYNKKLDMFGTCKLLLGRTLVSQKDIIDRYESNEYLLVKIFENIDDNEVDEFIEYIKQLPFTLVKPHIEHKNSYINVVAICNNTPTVNVINRIENFKCGKIYKFYFHGFSEVRLICVCPGAPSVIANKAGKSVKKVYLPAPFNKY